MRLAELRTRKGLTKTQLADAAKVDRTLITKIESGERKSFREDTMKRIADALGVTQDDIDEFAPLMQGKEDRVTAINSHAVLTTVSDDTLAVATAGGVDALPVVSIILA